MLLENFRTNKGCEMKFETIKVKILENNSREVHDLIITVGEGVILKNGT